MSNTEQYEQEGEESYFVSMTDIMVGMVFVFIILLMYFVFRIQNTSDPVVSLSAYQGILAERDNLLNMINAARFRVNELEEEIKRLNRNPLEKYLNLADAARENILTDLQNSMKKVPGINDGDVKVIREQGILRLSGDMLFPKGASNIAPGSPSDSAIRALSMFTQSVPYTQCFKKILMT